jgi:hypothetical protein
VHFKRTSESSSKLRSFEQAEGRLAVALEEFGNAQAGSVFDAVVEVDKTPSELARQLRADGSFSGTHKSGEGHDGN